MTSIFQKNPYVFIDKEDNRKLVNTVTGEKLLCGEKIIEIISFLEEPKNLSDITLHFEEIKNDIPNVLSSLVAKKFLIKNQEFEKAITALKPYTPHLFNLPQLLEKTHSNITEASVGFIGIPLGIGNRGNGAAGNFPNILRAFTSKYGVNLSTKISFDSIGSTNEFEQILDLIQQKKLFDLGNIFFDSKESPHFMYKKIHTISKKIFVEAKIIPFFIGGDHSISYPIIKAALDKYGEDLCVLHFDAHTDTYKSTYDKINHNHDIHHHGNFLSKCFEVGLKHAYQFGIRGIVNMNQKSNENQTIYWAHQIQEILSNEIVIKSLPKDKKYYITFDFDVIDPIYFKGTSTPVINGLTIRECKQLLRKVLHDKEIIGIDIVELYGDNEEAEITKQIACEIIFELLNGINN